MTARLKLAGQVVALACVAGLLSLLVWRLTHQEHAPAVGAAAPTFTLKRLDGGGTVSLAALRGQPVVLNFWASWCGPCKTEAKALEQAWSTYRGRGVAFVGVDFHDVTGDARRFVAAHKLTFPMVQDGSGDVTGSYGITQVPETYVLDRQGRIVAHLAGPITDSSFAAAFRNALAKAAALIVPPRPPSRRSRSRSPARLASVRHPRTSLSYLEGQVMCPTCHTTLDQSDSAAARQIEAFIKRRIAACATADQIKAELVQNFGAGILAAPPRRGFDLLAWWLPIGGVLGGALLLAVGVWRWSRGRGADGARAGARPGRGAAPRRAARPHRLMGVRLAVSFAAGFASVITPCVLPLVPGYLSAISSVEAGRLGERGTARRVAVSSIPFILGFTVVFVVLGAGAAAIGSALSGTSQTDLAGFVLVVLGLAFVGLLPIPSVSSRRGC